MKREKALLSNCTNIASNIVNSQRWMQLNHCSRVLPRARLVIKKTAAITTITIIIIIIISRLNIHPSGRLAWLFCSMMSLRIGIPMPQRVGTCSAHSVPLGHSEWHSSPLPIVGNNSPAATSRQMCMECNSLIANLFGRAEWPPKIGKTSSCGGGAFFFSLSCMAPLAFERPVRWRRRT